MKPSHRPARTGMRRTTRELPGAMCSSAPTGTKPGLILYSRPGPTPAPGGKWLDGNPSGGSITRQRIPCYTRIASVLLALWVLGLVTSTTQGGFVHILLVIAAAVFLLQAISGRRSL